MDPFLICSQLLVQHRDLAVKGLRQAHERLMVRVLQSRHVLRVYFEEVLALSILKLVDFASQDAVEFSCGRGL